jgi:phenylacetate-coenzyme A ligase PaaK-like adenylate-forming protein
MNITDKNAIQAKIFSVQTNNDFEQLSLDVFRLQCKENKVYGQYVQALGIKAEDISRVEDIPFLPVSFFKTHEVVCGKPNESDTVFTSSSTTSDSPSRNIVKDIEVYRSSFRKCFSLFYGNVKDYNILALLPSYLERTGSSLVYMAEDMVKESNSPDSGFYLNNYDELIEKLSRLNKEGKKVLLLGVTYALLKLAEEYPMQLSNTIIMETGGMKGKRKEMPKKEMHEVLKKAFGVKQIHSEYGMTELLSQAYSKGEGIFKCPPWMKIMVRDIYDPLKVTVVNSSGGINIIDLANINSCSFIATDDVGMVHSDGSFEISGRIDYSDIRGCNLMAEEL